MLKIMDNTIINSLADLPTNLACGIWIADSKATVSGNTITCNSADATASYKGIMVAATKTAMLTGNTISIDMSSNNITWGIYHGGNLSTLSKNKITVDNDDTTSNHYGIDVFSGISIGGGNGNVIEGNEIDLVRNNAKDIGINLQLSSPGYAATNNQGSDNLTANCGTGIVDSGTGNNVTGKDI